MDNCVTCCYRCNYMKSNMSTEEFLDQIKAIYNHSVGLEKKDGL